MSIPTNPQNEEAVYLKERSRRATTVGNNNRFIVHNLGTIYKSRKHKDCVEGLFFNFK